MGEQTKEDEILKSQQLYLIYSQSRILYKILPNSPRVETDPMKETLDPHANGVIGSIVGQVTNSMGQVSLQ